MLAQPLLGAVARQSMGAFTYPLGEDARPLSADPIMDAVISAAVLVTTAFRLRDEVGLVGTLRELTHAVAVMEAAQEQQAQRAVS
jgi:hypothetical protein